MLSIENLTVQFGGLKALDAVSFEVRPGEIVGLIGPNGAGKTTAFNAISRFVPAQQGGILFNGIDLTISRPHDLVGFGIARTFQNLGLFPYLSVIDNMLLGQQYLFKSGPLGHLARSRRSRLEESSLRKKSVGLLEQIGLESIKDAYVLGLPYGVQKFVEVCRALVVNPRLVLLDEPAAGLTSAETEQMRQLILRARSDFGVTVLLIEHDMALVMNTCERIIALDFGKVIAQGVPAEIQNHPKVVEAYLGQTEASRA